LYSLLHKVAKNIKDNNLLRVGETVVTGVSGGADSIALLDILFSLKELRLRIIVAHLNHMLRGGDSDDDAAFVRDMALKYDLTFESRSIDVYRFSMENGLSLEEGGREARYAWFDEVAARTGAHAVAVGHHADDQAETVLMRLLRGAGTSGLSGMSPKAGGRYIRPLLCATRKEIEDYLQKRNIPFRNDGTNSDTRFLRNRIRRELLPYLKTYNPSICDRLIATAQILSADETLLETITDQAFHRLALMRNDEIIIDIPALLSEPQGLRFRVYRKAIRAAKGNLLHMTLKHLQLIDDLALSRKANSHAELPGHLKIAKCYQSLSIISSAADRHAGQPELLMEGPGVYPLQGNRILSITVGRPPRSWKNLSPWKACFDLDAAPFPWTVRTFRAGDRFVPLGMSGSKKLKDFFIDMKIPPQDRRTIPLIVCNGRILWIAGLRTAADARLTAGTKAVIAAEVLEDQA
jgi:tRNA(Ile)-lysidine synthase